MLRSAVRETVGPSAYMASSVRGDFIKTDWAAVQAAMSTSTPTTSDKAETSRSVLVPYDRVEDAWEEVLWGSVRVPEGTVRPKKSRKSSKSHLAQTEESEPELFNAMAGLARLVSWVPGPNSRRTKARISGLKLEPGFLSRVFGLPASDSGVGASQIAALGLKNVEEGDGEESEKVRGEEGKEETPPARQRVPSLSLPPRHRVTKATTDDEKATQATTSLETRLELLRVINLIYDRKSVSDVVSSLL